MRMRFFALAGPLIIMAVFFAEPAASKEFPEKPIEIICPYTPGSSMDILARLIADVAPKYFGQQLIVVNKGGAAASIAAADVITSKPDGYKSLIVTNLFFAMTIKTQKVPFDENDLVPLGSFMEYKIGLLVRGDSPWKSFNDLLSHARKEPGQLKWAHTGRGNPPCISGLITFNKAGVKTIDVPYKGSPELLTALLGGHVDAAVMAHGAIADHVKSGKLRYLMVYSDHRYGDLPNVPTTIEVGIPEPAKLIGYVGLYARKETPEPIKKKLITILRKVQGDPELKKGIETMGEDPKFGGPEFTRDAIKQAEEVGVPVLKELGLYVSK